MHCNTIQAYIGWNGSDLYTFCALLLSFSLLAVFRSDHNLNGSDPIRFSARPLLQWVRLGLEVLTYLKEYLYLTCCVYLYGCSVTTETVFIKTCRAPRGRASVPFCAFSEYRLCMLIYRKHQIAGIILYYKIALAALLTALNYAECIISLSG
jgi:hypothetical protein